MSWLRILGENEAVAESENDADSARGERPAIARGLPLAAYSDDQLDEVALWVASDGVERGEEEQLMSSGVHLD